MLALLESGGILMETDAPMMEHIVGKQLALFGSNANVRRRGYALALARFVQA